MKYNSILVADGSYNTSKILKYNYLGEEFGSVPCLMNRAMRSSWMDSYKQTMEVKLGVPCLGLMKGSKVNFYWYELSETTKSIMKEEIGSNISLPASENSEDDQYMLNGEMSGQYYIKECTFEYQNLGNWPEWTQTLIISRNADNVETYVTEEERPLDKSSFNTIDEPAADTGKETGSFIDTVKSMLANITQ